MASFQTLHDEMEQKDGFQTTGCYNTACPGFQHEAGAHITPGDVISPVSGINGAKRSITIKVYKVHTYI
jgi:hypothetical protein